VYAAAEPDLDKAMDGPHRLGLSFRDALLWATALWATADRTGVRYLLSADFQDGGATFVDPFKPDNERLLAEILPPP
jgi:predicted nucleic acid-binding protein